jgi:hypothetical protein
MPYTVVDASSAPNGQRRRTATGARPIATMPMPIGVVPMSPSGSGIWVEAASAPYTATTPSTNRPRVRPMSCSCCRVSIAGICGFYEGSAGAAGPPGGRSSLRAWAPGGGPV